MCVKLQPIRKPSRPSVQSKFGQVRTHRSLHKDAPIFRPFNRSESFVHTRSLGGLHHHYGRI
jgi:hypothetical protein